MFERLSAVNASGPFNGWAGFELGEVERGRAELRLRWREEFAQYSGFLHAGLQSALIETACGFAASTEVGPVLVSHLSVNYMSPARGRLFSARAVLVKPGRRQIYARAELFAEGDEGLKLVATGETLLVAA